MIHRIAMLIFLWAFAHGVLPAQSSDLSVSLRNFTLQKDQTGSEGRRGIVMKFDLRFSKVITDFRSARFDLTWRLEDAGGKTVYYSADQDDYVDQKELIMARKPWDQNVSYMEKTDVEVTIPFALMHLPAGPQKLKVVFSLKNEAYQLPDFASREIEFEQKVFVKHGLDEQTFAVENLKFTYNVKGFAVDDPGMKINLTLTPRYGPDESRDESYAIYWQLRDQGKILFDSRKCASIHHQSEGVYLKNLKEGKGDNLEMFLNYTEINMRSPAEVELVLLAMANDDTKEIYSGKYRLEVPVKFRFDEQEFSLSDLSAAAGALRGAGGIRIRCRVKLSKFGPRLDAEKGNYFFYPVVRDQSGKVIWQPEELTGQEYGSSVLSYQCDAFSDKGVLKVEFFIPWYVLKISPGSVPLQYSIFASDRNRGVRFPELGKGGLVAKAPNLYRYHMRLTDLEMKPSNYDTEIAPFGSSLPDLQWSFRIGGDRVYVSSKRKNSLLAEPGEHTYTVAEGDTCSLVLYDIDSGFFNASDFLGSWNLPFKGQGEKFTIEHRDEGLLSLLRMEFEKR